MYTKVFRQIYDGTLANNWQAMVTFQQLLILADESGTVDMTVEAIHRTTGIPQEILERGLAVLEAPDAGSRTPDMEGRRIARLDDHRSWGWFLVNFGKYRKIQSRDEKKEADRKRIADKRNAEKGNKIISVAECREVSLGVASVANVAHTDTDTEEEQERCHLSPAKPATAQSDLLPADAVPDPAAKRAQRLAEVSADALETFNGSALVKSGGGMVPNVSGTVGREKRQQQVARCVRTARSICVEAYVSQTITRQFWVDYWDACAKDDHKSGRSGGGKDHPNWTPSFEYLTRERTMLEVYDQAAAEA